ncbi:RING-H2 finger protein ATL74-like [Panicum virgatum]|uniref:RING-type domain-containing protein n=1 Tax=Panicum virgatum TaxID=38727 RepID=A0A8T0TYL1_PANVG|nr:RING-H2 finger protein ATL74-like [Panicum virgatum]KAG2614868.1 hypothetical protein PVAP13_3NG014500 [Panicum virgatum]
MASDEIMERSLAAAIESSVAATAGTLIWLIPIPPQNQHHSFQEQEPAARLFPDHDDDGQHNAGDDVVASLLDEISPRESDLDERILECPVTQRLVLLALASLQQEVVVDAQISSLLLEAAEAYRDGGFGAVPADAAAVASLGKQTFRTAAGAGGDGGGSVTCTCCSVCLEDFEDGDEISVMPCSGGHGFHTNCIAEWLGRYSNMCPLCRHALPTGGS